MMFHITHNWVHITGGKNFEICQGKNEEGLPVFRPHRTSMSVVFPAPELPTSAVSTPGWKAPLQSHSRRSMVEPSTTAARGPIFSGSVVLSALSVSENQPLVVPPGRVGKGR